MILMSVLALINGLLIGLARAINARLTISNGAFNASFWNHLIGFLFLSILMVFSTMSGIELQQIPLVAFLGGVIGAIYVAVNSYIVPKLGATIATLLVISGQLVTSTLLDVYRGILTIDLSIDTLKLIIGILLISLGVYSSIISRKS